MNANPVTNLPPHPACTCGKGKVRGFLCWPCYEASDDGTSTAEKRPSSVESQHKVTPATRQRPGV